MTSIGHNEPPLAADPLLERLRIEHHKLSERVDYLLEREANLGPVDESNKGRVADYLRLIRHCVRWIEDTKRGEKEHFLAHCRTIDSWAHELRDPLDELIKRVSSRLDAYVEMQPSRVRYHTGEGGVLGETTRLKYEVLDRNIAVCNLARLIDDDCLEKAVREFIRLNKLELRDLLERDPPQQPLLGVRFEAKRKANVR